MAVQGFGPIQTNPAPVSENKVVIPSNGSNVKSSDSSNINSKIESKNTTTKAKRRTKPETSSGKGIFRDIPSNVIKAVRAEFADATNNTDALMAYLACHGSGSVAERANANLTETQQELVNNWDGDSYSAVVKQLEELVSKFDRLSKKTDVIELLATYMVYDRLGFRSDNPATPRDTNLREDGVVDVALAAEEQTVGFQHEKQTIQGRPFRR